MSGPTTSKIFPWREALGLPHTTSFFPGASVVKNLPAVWELQETRVRSLGWEDPLEEGMATHSRIPWTEEPGRLQSIESQRVRHDWSDLAWMHLYVSVCVSVWYVYTCIHTHTCTHVVKPFISTIRLTYPSPHIVNFRHTWNFNSSHGAIYWILTVNPPLTTESLYALINFSPISAILQPLAITILLSVSEFKFIFFKFFT